MRHWPDFLRRALGVIFSMATVLVTSLVLFSLKAYLSTPVVTLLYLVPVLISAAYWGIVGGITASILSFLAYNYLFIFPHYTFLVARPQDILVIVVLLGVATLISSLIARVQANLEQAHSREREALQLSRLSFELIEQHDQAGIAQSLAEHLSEFFGNALILVEVFQENSPIRVQAPAHSQPPDEPPAVQAPLSSARGLLGRISIWKEPDHPQPEETRLVQAFASQGALALERAALSAAETRARVLEESDRLKTAILSSVSHELRTPLATIQASVTSLFNSDVDMQPEARSELQSLVIEETNQMIQLVGNLLNMSRIEAGALKPQRQWNSFAEIVDISVRSLERFSASHKIMVDVSEDLPLVAVDPVLMEQVMINLVKNSIKFSPQHTPIQISAGADEQVLTVTVTNEGPPIPPGDLDHIFEKFYAVPGRETTQGTGLGLSICKGIVEAHGGHIWANNLERGVAFHFTIPLSWEGMRPALPDEEKEGT